MRADHRYFRALAFLGVVTLTATGAGGEQVSEGALHFSCGASEGVDPARVAVICDEFRDILKAQPGVEVVTPSDGLAADVPGLEISVTRATDTQLELVPTWIDGTGQRRTMPSTGFVIMDTAMTQAMRRDLFLQVLANPPK